MESLFQAIAMAKRLYVGNLSYSVDSELLQEMFEQFGRVRSAQVLIDRETIIEIAEFLQPVDFYRQANGTIYKAMLELFERREPVDLVTVAESLERSESLARACGDEVVATNLSRVCEDPPRTPHHALRKLRQTCRRTRPTRARRSASR